MTQEERRALYQPKVYKAPNGCWLWTGEGRDSYPMLRTRTWSCSARRFVYETENTTAIQGRQLTATCDQPGCVNPEHVCPRRERPRPERQVVPHAVRPKPTVWDRFWSHVDKAAGPNGCWAWTACTFSSDGAPLFSSGKRNHRAQRWLMDQRYGLDRGDRVVAVCNTPHCMNPKHLKIRRSPSTTRDQRLPPAPLRGPGGGFARQVWERVRIDREGCWVWDGVFVNPNRQAVLFQKSLKTGEMRPVAVTRYLYGVFYRPIPKTESLIRVCKNPDCVNPHHRVVAHEEAMVR